MSITRIYNRSCHHMWTLKMFIESNTFFFDSDCSGMLSYTFKTKEALDEYDRNGGHDCVQKAPLVQSCMENNKNNSEEYISCLKRLKFNEDLFEKLKDIPHNENFTSNYNKALIKYVQAIDEKYAHLSSPSKLVFKFDWIPWALLILAFLIVYLINRKKPVKRVSKSSQDPKIKINQNV